MNVIKVIVKGEMPTCCLDCQFIDRWHHEWVDCDALPGVSIPMKVGEFKRPDICPLTYTDEQNETLKEYRQAYSELLKEYQKVRSEK